MTSHGIYLALAFLFPFLLTYVIAAKSDYARLIVYLNLMTVLLDVANLGLGRGLQQMAIQLPLFQAIRALRRPLQGALAVFGLISLALTATLTLAMLTRPVWFEGNGWIVFWLWLAVELGLFRLLISSLLYGLQQYGWFIALDISWAALRLAVVPALWWAAGLEGALAAQGLLWAMGIVPGLFILGRHGLRPALGSWRKAFSSLRYYLRLGLWMHLTSLSAGLVRPLAVLTLAWMVGGDHPALASAHLAFSLFLVSTILLDSLFMGLYPEKARAGVEGRHGELSVWAGEEARSLGFLLWPVAFAVAWLTTPMVRVLRPEYHDLGLWLAPIVLAMPARAMAAPLIVAQQAGHRALTGAAYQLLRLALDLLGLGVSMIGWNGSSAAPAWGIMAGEWTATILLIITLPMLSKHRAGWPIRLSRDSLSSLGMILIVALWTIILWIITGGRAGWTAWLIMSLGWFALVPLTPLVHWKGVMHTFTPRRVPAAEVGEKLSE